MAANGNLDIKTQNDKAPLPNEIDPIDIREKHKRKIQLTKLKMIIIAATSLAIIGGVIAFFYYRKHQADMVEKEKQEADAIALQNIPIYTDLDEMIVNLDTRGKGINFLKLKITLEVKDQPSLVRVTKLMPKIKDTFQIYLRELRPSDLYGSISLYRLREELLIRINKILYPARINDILFKDVLVQ